MKHQPRKRFGQHFLHDNHIIQQIVATLAPQPDQHLIEIGPGQGALTLPVLRQAKQLEAIELDRDLIAPLQERCRDVGVLQIHVGDILKFNLTQLKTDARLLRIFGNLPYNISTPLIFHLLSFTDIIADMLFMLQKEVAERLAAPVNSDHYGRLSVMVQYHCEVQLLFNVPASAFQPPPQVESSIVRLLPRTISAPARDDKLFSDIVKHAFGQRRKTLRNSLRDFISDDAWKNMPVSPQARAENVSVDEFVMMSNLINKYLK